MKQKRQYGELALLLQEARRQRPDAYRVIAAGARMDVRRVKAIAYGAEPTQAERSILAVLARG